MVDSVAYQPARPRADRMLLTAAIVLSTVMPAIDTTIANVALPLMGGSMSASVDQIVWVLTAYIVAVAVVTPISAWLANRFGRRRVFLISVIGFTVASGLCGAAQNLAQVIVFRALQGALSAPLGPLAQAVILDAYEPEERGPALATWTMGLMVAPIMGPVLGGYLSEALSWRWVFYINVPIGVLAALGVAAFIPAETRNPKAQLDLPGWSLLSVFVVSLQLLLDRGQTKDWLGSAEIRIYALVCLISLYVFAVHVVTARKSFLPLPLVFDRNFVSAICVMVMMCLQIFSSMALIPLLLQNFMGYSVQAAGWIIAPRGIASFISSYLAGRLVARIDGRALIGFGMALFVLGFWVMCGITPDMDARLIVWSGVLQGAGSGFVFLPLTTMAFATVDPKLRTDATGFFNLARNIGASLGISLLITAHTRFAQIAYARLTEAASLDNPLIRAAAGQGGYDLASPDSLAALGGEIARQAAIVAYAQVFQLLLPCSLAMVPLVLFMRRGVPPATGRS